MHNAEIMEINFKLNELFSFQPKGLAYCDTKLSTSGEHWMTGAEHIFSVSGGVIVGLGEEKTCV